MFRKWIEFDITIMLYAMMIMLPIVICSYVYNGLFPFIKKKIFDNSDYKTVYIDSKNKTINKCFYIEDSTFLKDLKLYNLKSKKVFNLTINDDTKLVKKYKNFTKLLMFDYYKNESKFIFIINEQNTIRKKEIEE